MKKSLIYITFLLLACQTVYAQGGLNTSQFEFDQSSTLKIFKNVESNLLFTNDFQSNQKAVGKKDSNISAIELFLSSDLNKSSNIDGNLNIHFVHVGGNNPADRVNDIQMTSNISAPKTINRLTDFWYEQNIGEKNKLLFGVHDISSEFYVTDNSLNFTHASFGTGAELSSSGVHGPSLYPVTTIGLRHQLQLSKKFSLKSAVYDADPGEDVSKAISYKYNHEEGIFFISEVNHTNSNHKSGLAFWSYDKKQSHIESPDFRSTKSFGAYSFHEQNFSDRLSAFARLGWANPIATAIKNNFSTGVVYREIFQNDLKDEIGLGFTVAQFSNQYLRNAKAELESLEEDATSLKKDESAIELYYQTTPIKTLSLRPDFQYVKNPSGNSTNPDAVVVGLRAQINI